MKKNLKSYNNYEKDHIKEFFNPPAFKDWSKHLNDVIQNDEETTVLSTDEIKKVEDVDITENLPVEEIPNVSMSSTSISIEVSVPDQNMNSPCCFSVVRIMTNNGEKIAMCYSDVACNYGASVCDNLDFNSACEKVKSCCIEFCCSEFKNDCDSIIGSIPSFMISKNMNKK